MSDLKVQIQHFEELEEWLPSYPGDKMVRPPSFTFTFRTNDRDLLKEWLDLITESYKLHVGYTRFTNKELNQHAVHPLDIHFPEGWLEGKVQFSNKRAAMLFKLAFS